MLESTQFLVKNFMKYHSLLKIGTVATVVVSLGLFIPQISGAAAVPTPSYAPNNTGTISDFPNFISRLGGNVANIFGTLILAISVIMILYSAFLFLTAQGDATKLTTARNVLLFALVGVAVALLAYILPNAVSNFVQTNVQ
ncbi:MAG: hypothetical protein HY220_02275 [Candidatus Sungbacteria bacterium]|uniref:TrbC/VirB2 family protein n=1 Tax=Candidatus Sungiibacteriota bacterium TaxID=2750080 RepID=A0A9D6LPV8_9BACT|nr:hypothetical protein [Candidatus Sungbacteria bacterium]